VYISRSCAPSNSSSVLLKTVVIGVSELTFPRLFGKCYILEARLITIFKPFIIYLLFVFPYLFRVSVTGNGKV
jgi:hypothetical protein